jgi:putative two-component system response regulator
MNTPPKILLVDDDEVQLQVIGHAIQSMADYLVLTTTNALTAYTMAEKHQPEVILSDYFMPEQDGFTFCKRIKAHPQLRRSSFILLTSATTIEQRVRGLDLGADDYITKPFHTEELMSRIRAALRIQELNDEVEAEKKELARLNKELEDGFMGIISLLTHLIGHRVPNASLRGERAAAMSTWVGERLEMKDDDLKLMQIAARLHEIGKVSFPDDLVKKPYAQLNEHERSAVSHFPIMGQLILAGIPSLKEVGRFLRHQMENYDGSGYPDKLTRDQIPLHSKILRAINLIELETMLRNPSVEQLVGTLNRNKGTVLDVHIVQLVSEYLEVIENPTWREGKRQVSVQELKVGMTIAHDLTTGSGTKLLSDKSKISVSILERIIAHHTYDPIINNIYVYDP